MELKTITNEMRDQLRAPLPDEAVHPHPTKTYLSSIKAIYVTERLNDVFGVGQWQIRCDKECEGENGMVVVKVTFTIPAYGIHYECFGGNDNGGEGSKNFDLGDAFKGATTDAITKIGSWMGIGLDVFQGKRGKPANRPQQGQQAAPKDDLKWLNKFTDKSETKITNEYQEVVLGAVEGIFPTMGDIKAAFRVSKATEKELIEDIKQEKLKRTGNGKN